MDDLKSVTMSYLRNLARKHLGSGYSKLTKKELIAALAEFVPAVKKLAQLAGVKLPARSKPAAKVGASATKQSREPTRAKETRAVDKKDKKKEPEKKAPAAKKEPEKKAAAPKKEPEKKAHEPKKEPEKKSAAPQGRKGPASRSAASKEEDASASKRPAQVVNFPPRVRLPRSAEEAWQEDTAEMVVASPELEAVFQHAAEPLVEGFFVARMMGERELRRHHLTEEQAPRSKFENGAVGSEENLGELPLDYGNDLALALARDPHTLFITWDFSAATRARAMEGLNEPRAMLRVFDGERLVRELEVVLESRSFYIHGLPPGRPYRVEAHFVDRGGRSRRIGSSTHPLTLPHTGPSPDKSVRFMQLPPPPIVPVQSVAPAPVVATALSREEQGQERQYITWHRVPLPGSADLSERPVDWRERVGRRGEGARPPPPPSPPPEHLEVSARPPGSSEQTAGRGGPSRGGASEQTHWTPPPSGRGR